MTSYARKGLSSKIIAAIIIVVIVIGAAAYMITRSGGEGKTPEKTATTQAPRIQKLVIGAVGGQFNLDPATAWDYPSIYVLSLTMEGLVRVNPQTGAIEPGLAVKWSTPDNGLTWVFILREDAKFPDGTPVTADQVVNSVLRVQALRGPYSWLVTAFVYQVQALNDTAVQFRLKTPVANFPGMLASHVFYVVSPDYPLLQPGSDLTSGGAGRYKVESYSPKEIVLTPNPNYYGDEPRVKRLVVKLYPDSASLAQALRNGEVDVAWWGLQPGDAQGLESAKVESTDKLVLKLLALRTTGAAPTADRDVREALAILVNQPLIANSIEGDLDAPLYSVIPTGLLGYKPVFQTEFAGKTRADALDILNSKGYTQANKLVLKMIISTEANGPVDAVIAEIIKQQFEETQVIRVEISDLRAPAYYSALAQGDYDIALVTLYPVVSPDPLYYIVQTLYSKANRLLGTGYSNPQADISIESVLSTLDYSFRESAYELLQTSYLAKDIPYIPLVSTGVLYAVPSDIDGIALLPNLVLYTP